MSPAEVTADAAIVIDRGTGRVLFAKHDRERLGMASTTKIMTALLAIELVECSTAAPHYTTECTYTSTAERAAEEVGKGSHADPPLVVGEQLTVQELLQAMLLPSDNVSAFVLAESLAGSWEVFVALMNWRAAELGLTDTNFTSPNGAYAPDHYTTARDLAVIAEAAMTKLMFRSIVRTSSTTVFGDLSGAAREHLLYNTNDFVDPASEFYDPEVIGVKTGSTTETGYCLVTVAVRGDDSLLTVVLGSARNSDRYRDTRKLQDFGWDRMHARAETTSYAAGDFDGDGYRDLAIGMPQSPGGGHAGAGKVALLRGSPIDIRPSPVTTIVQGDGAMTDPAEDADGFGHALAAGDFDGDGFADLAIGVPWEDIDGKQNTGMVEVVYGSASGLSTTRVLSIHQGSSGIPGANEDFDAFGQSLAAGDFNGDGYCDLAIGIPGEDIGADVDAGGLVVLHGSSVGLLTSTAIYLHQDSTGVPGVVEPGDEFAFALAVGRFDQDPYDDLAIGVPGEDVTTDTGVEADAGMVCVIRGSPTGLNPTYGALAITDESYGPSSGSETGDRLGAALAAGDSNGDGIDDLAVGAPGEDYTSSGLGVTFFQSGAVLVLLGTATGLTDEGSSFLTEQTPGVGAIETLDAFGTAVCFGDFDGDGFADLAIGIPGEDATTVNEGAVVVVAGTAHGPDPSVRCDRLSPLEPAVEGQFGSSLGAGDFGDGVADLAVAIAAYFADGAWRHGATRVYDGRPGGLSPAHTKTFAGL